VTVETASFIHSEVVYPKTRRNTGYFKVRNPKIRKIRKQPIIEKNQNIKVAQTRHVIVCVSLALSLTALSRSLALSLSLTLACSHACTHSLALSLSLSLSLAQSLSHSHSVSLSRSRSIALTPSLSLSFQRLLLMCNARSFYYYTQPSTQQSSGGGGGGTSFSLFHRVSFPVSLNQSVCVFGLVWFGLVSDLFVYVYFAFLQFSQFIWILFSGVRYINPLMLLGV